MSIEYSKRALDDLDSISSYYAELADRGTAERFEARLQAVIERLERSPASAQPVTGRPGVRVALLNTFPYKVFCRVQGADRIRVLHVRHTSRRPWRG
jgi:plasmid stabilization system protein ParE